MDDFKWNFAQSKPTPVNDTEFRWNWAKANVDPSYKIQGPGIGSLLRAINPETQADAIQQMNNNLATDRANIETIAKQGAAENQMLENLWNQNYKEQYDTLQRAKNQTAKVNAYNDAVKMYMDAPTEEARELAKESIRANFPDKADEIFAVAESNRQKIEQQSDNYVSWFNTLPDDFETKEQKDEKKKELDELRRTGSIDEKQYAEGSKKLEGMIPTKVQTKRTVKQATDTKQGKDVVEKNDKTLYLSIYNSLPKNLSASMKATQAKKLFRERHGRDYTGE